MGLKGFLVSVEGDRVLLVMDKEPIKNNNNADIIFGNPTVLFTSFTLYESNFLLTLLSHGCCPHETFIKLMRAIIP